MLTLTATAPPPLSRSTESQRAPLRVGLVQHRWRPDADELTAALRAGIDRAAAEGATAVFLPEITLLRYPADQPGGADPGVGRLWAKRGVSHVGSNADSAATSAGSAAWPRSAPSARSQPAVVRSARADR